MITLIVSTSARGLRQRHNVVEREVGWRQRAWRRFVDWLMEPIPFPMKTYHLDPPDECQSDEKCSAVLVVRSATGMNQSRVESRMISRAKDDSMAVKPRNSRSKNREHTYSS
jgi:hypothetical protein